MSEKKEEEIKSTLLMGTSGVELLTFRGPCIVIYSYNKNKLDALISQIYF
jgi:hypothetical protein